MHVGQCIYPDWLLKANGSQNYAFAETPADVAFSSAAVIA